MPDLLLPDQVMRIAEIVAAEFGAHERHARDRGCVAAAEHFAARAHQLRTQPTLSDPLAWALTQRCHTRDGVVHAAPAVVAAVAYEVVAAVLALGDPTPTPDGSGSDRTVPDTTRGDCHA